jgi:glycosyltransferase involved in cell wall biosynthesis
VINDAAHADGRTVISAITVCFNCATTLPATIESLHSQTWPWREWVVVDGGSTDETQNVVLHNPERPAKYVSEPDKGIYDAMNKAVALASGDVVFFLNADDALYDEHVFADVAHEFEADPSLDFLFGNIVVRRPHSKTYKRYRHINRWTLPFEDLCHQAVFARRSLFERVGSFDLRWPTSADYDWFLRVLTVHGKLKYINRRVAFFAAGGFHSRQPQALADERRELRLQYMSPLRLAAGTLIARAAQKASKLLRNGHGIGESPDR